MPVPHLFHNWVELYRHGCKICVSYVPLLSPSLWVLTETQPVKERQANFRGLTESQEVNQAIRTSAFFDVQIRKPVKPILNLS
jgi:hypothetical protein